eukprot:jgi/Astpho2/8404/Aster-01460
MAAAAAPAATPDRSLSRSLSFDVGTLRAAASAAVAECTGGKGLGVHSTQRDPHPALERPSDGSVQSKLSSLTSGGDIATTEGVTQGTGSLSLVDDEHSGKSSDSQLHLTKAQLHEALNACPPHGAKAICGRRPRMEDAYTAVPFLLEAPAAACKEGPSNSVMETLHFFGVFDGHGGAEAALHCAQTLHQRIAEALSAVSSPSAQSKIAESFAASQVEAQLSAGMRQSSGICKCPGEKCTCGLRHPKSGPPSGSVSHQVSGTFPKDVKMQSLVQPEDPAGDDSDGSEGFLETLQREVTQERVPAGGNAEEHKTEKEDLTCSSLKIESALTNAFTKADEEFGKADNAALVGTTAVVALVGSRQLFVANCGDSRAVLCRNGTAIPLTDDHKAAREDETARVEAAGGQILFWNGVRVMGVLAVSRAIGDHCLRPFVIAQPEITILSRRQEDELLLLASDGLWDVLTNQEACSLAKRCLRRARQRGATRHSAARIAATVLTRAAVDRGSRDNVTVVVVDLSSGSDADSLARTPSSLGDATLDGLGSEGTNGSEATPRVSDGGEGAAS